MSEAPDFRYVTLLALSGITELRHGVSMLKIVVRVWRGGSKRSLTRESVRAWVMR